MPIHDWTRVGAGTFHHFHQQWVGALAAALNTGGLPPGYFALIEQRVGGPSPDVLALEWKSSAGRRPAGTAAVHTTPPKTRFVTHTEAATYARRADRLTIRHDEGEVVAVIEIVSPGNKDSRHALRSFTEKTGAFLATGVHLLVVDLLPPTKRDPQGIHKAIWDQIREEPFALPPDKPLTLAAYSAGPELTAYVEPVAVGDVLPDMPLFLDPGEYVNAPLEATYQTTWQLLPDPLKEKLEPPPG